MAIWTFLQLQSTLTHIVTCQQFINCCIHGLGIGSLECSKVSHTHLTLTPKKVRPMHAHECWTRTCHTRMGFGSHQHQVDGLVCIQIAPTFPSASRSTYTYVLNVFPRSCRGQLEVVMYKGNGYRPYLQNGWSPPIYIDSQTLFQSRL